MAGSSAAVAPPQVLPHQTAGDKPRVDELFEHRWRKAYEVRALERESRQAKGQAPGAAAAEAVCALSLNGGAQVEAPGQLRQQEVVDDDDDEMQPTAAVAPGTWQHPQPAAAGQQQEGLVEEEQQEEAEPALTYVWDSSSRRPGSAVQPPPAAASGTSSAAGCAAAQLKEQGNALLKAGDFSGAVQCYTDGLAAATAGRQHRGERVGLQAGAGKQTAAAEVASGASAGEGPAADHTLLATLHSNRAHALLKLKRNEEAAADALQAHRLHPGWPKPLYRLAQAKLALGLWAAAVVACKAGEALSPLDSEGHSEFTPLLDRTAVHAARAGSLAGFDGGQLEVRCAGDEAWLGGAAPHVPELDGPEDEDAVGPATTLALPATPGGGSAAGSGALAVAAASIGSGAGTTDALAAWDYRQLAGVRQRRRTSFRSMKEAVAAARDGDCILLCRGVHNGMGESITITKRLLIEGEGALGEAVIDQRANCPTFRIARGGVVLRNIDLDQTGFREALLVDGPSSVHPLVQGCKLRCSGDDAVNIGGSAAPTFLRCTISAKKCGLEAYGSSAPRLEACTLEQCGEQGVRAQEGAAPLLHGCTISECAEEAVVGMDAARITLHSCTLRDCKGPGVDLSGTAQASISGGRVEACVGGVWLWDNAHASLQRAKVAGGPSHAILADGGAVLEVRDCTVRGSVHATERAWAGILHPSNRLEQPEGPTDFPPEEGPFRFTPNPYTRKQ